MMPHGTVPVALLAAAAWGGGDFAGGMGVKAAGGSATGALRVIVLAHAASLAVLVVWLLAKGAPWPHGAAAAWALGAGVAAGLSLAAFYLALARGAMGASAALSGLLAAAIPVAVSSLLEGSPGAIRLLGFALALLAIWMIAAGPPAAPGSRSALRLATAGGIGFGLYFVALRMANSLGVPEPMALARTGSLLTCALLLALLSRQPGERRGTADRPMRAWLPWAAGVALLDTGGNLLFLAATRLGRLDVAAVLASLYPASTILLAAWWLHERPTRRQLAGMAVAAAAVVAITL